MAAERTALVLGGGGMKGLAHVGAWRAVQEAGIAVTEIVGTSIGALVGAAIGCGLDDERLADLAGALQKKDIITVNRWALLFNGIRQESVFRGDIFEEYIARTLTVDTFAALRLPLSVNAVDLASGEQVWFGAGGRDVPLAEAVYASCALPVFYPPARIGGRYYVDGGVGDALPIARAFELGADRVIAVDVAAGVAGDGEEAVAHGMVAIHHRVMQITGGSRRCRDTRKTESGDVVYIRPSLEGRSTFDFGSTAFFLEEGYRAAAEALSKRSP